jgi:hypothetical protein
VTPANGVSSQSAEAVRGDTASEQIAMAAAAHRGRKRMINLL